MVEGIIQVTEIQEFRNMTRIHSDVFFCQLLLRGKMMFTGPFLDFPRTFRICGYNGLHSHIRPIFNASMGYRLKFLIFEEILEIV